jgi:phosphoglycerate dehydrogenase-like enzyme
LGNRGILGYGAIGRQCARLAVNLGMEVYAYTRTERSTPESRRDDSYTVPGLGDPDGVLPKRWFHSSGLKGGTAVKEFLEQDLDLLVLSLPLTEATQYLLDREQFDVLASRNGRTGGTFVINISRGKHVRTEALIEALEERKIGGAALDVTDPEPLPEEDPLWKAPRCFITPHVSGHTPHYRSRVLSILETNLDRLSKGEPMINVMNRKEHY